MPVLCVIAKATFHNAVSLTAIDPLIEAVVAGHEDERF